VLGVASQIELPLDVQPGLSSAAALQAVTGHESGRMYGN
jgi:hypothetical protein